MTPEIWWRRRAGCAHTLMQGSFSNGMGRLDCVEPRMAAALSDILARPGSLVRAVTAYLTGIEMGVPEQSARAMACGIEYLHTASLVFDDLPAMDDARTRRGAACIHVVHGEAVAMLTALAVINRAYSMIWQGIHQANPQRRATAGEWVDARLGIGGVIGGQAYDLRGWRGEQSAAEVSEVAARKTGDLLRLTLVLPAIVGRGTPREIQILDRVALLRGLAYQAADDLKDVLSAEEDFGKTAGRDEALGRPNFVIAEGLPAALRRFRRLSDTGDRVQATLPGPADRWMMLEMLKVPTPVSAADTDSSLLSAVI
ncbi:MAG: polyprenyl synthetase family protein [Luteolibacter sp.]|uniref:polyprenyl synthetase family protein n=1 Tax=Luteolibacter sp. TaxID=1962973 RepID=UPI0032647643